MSSKIYAVLLAGKPVYVGCTTQSIRIRWQKHCSKVRLGTHSSPIFSEAIRTHGEAAFTLMLIEEHDDHDYAENVLEPKYIKEYHTHVSEGGLNITLGGSGRKAPNPCSPEKRARISASMKGKNKGRKMSPEHREKMRQGMVRFWDAIKDR